MTEQKMTRREFVGTSVAAATGIAVAARSAASYARTIGANDRIKLGVVGCGGRGKSFVNEVLPIRDSHNVTISAVCDLWSRSLDQMTGLVAERLGERPQAFRYHEDLLEKSDVDAIIITTPDFWHVPILLDALAAGKDAYIEKPMANNLEESREAVRAVRSSGRVVQVGTQRRSEGRYRGVAQWCREGHLGKISYIETFWNNPGPRWRVGNPNVLQPDEVDWDRYVSIIPEKRPFEPLRLVGWKLFRDCTVGVVALLGSHYIDVANWMTGDKYPLDAVANGGVFVWGDDGRETEDTYTGVFRYPGNYLLQYTSRFGNLKGILGTRECGCVIFGTRGVLYVDDARATGEGAVQGVEALPEEIRIPSAEGEPHLGNFIRCMRTREEPNAPIEVGYEHMVACILATEALDRGKKMIWDSQKEEMREA